MTPFWEVMNGSDKRVTRLPLEHFPGDESLPRESIILHLGLQTASNCIRRTALPTHPHPTPKVLTGLNQKWIWDRVKSETRPVGQECCTASSGSAIQNHSHLVVRAQKKLFLETPCLSHLVSSNVSVGLKPYCSDKKLPRQREDSELRNHSMQ